MAWCGHAYFWGAWWGVRPVLESVNFVQSPSWAAGINAAVIMKCMCNVTTKCISQINIFCLFLFPTLDHCSHCQYLAYHLFGHIMPYSARSKNPCNLYPEVCHNHPRKCIVDKDRIVMSFIQGWAVNKSSHFDGGLWEGKDSVIEKEDQYYQLHANFSQKEGSKRTTAPDVASRPRCSFLIQWSKRWLNQLSTGQF